MGTLLKNPSVIFIFTMPVIFPDAFPGVLITGPWLLYCFWPEVPAAAAAGTEGSSKTRGRTSRERARGGKRAKRAKGTTSKSPWWCFGGAT